MVRLSRSFTMATALLADTRRQRRYPRHSLHRCGPGLRRHILSILPRAMKPIVTILITVGRARPSHDELRVDGDLPQMRETSGLACQCTCRWSAAEHSKHDQGGHGPHGMHLLSIRTVSMPGVSIKRPDPPRLA